MTLAENPRFHKRLRETIIRAALIAPGVGVFKNPRTPLPPKYVHFEEPTAVVQSLTFVGYYKGDTAHTSLEIAEHRMAAATFNYHESSRETKSQLETEEKSYPGVSWDPYFVLIRKDGDKHALKARELSYNILEGEAGELIEYLSNGNRASKNWEGRRAQYPVSAISVQFPWNPEETHKGTPSPKELADLAIGLTRHSGQQLVVCVNGPEEGIKTYWENFIAATEQRNLALLADVSVNKGYIYTKGKSDPKKALQKFNSVERLKANPERFRQTAKRCHKRAADYVAAIKQMYVIGDTEVPAKVKEYEVARKQAEKYLEEIEILREITYQTTGSASAADLFNKGKKYTRPRLGETIPNEDLLEKATQLLEKAALEYECLLEEVIKKGHDCEESPWATRMILIRNKVGFEQGHPGEPFVRKLQKWTESDQEAAETHAKENRAVESHLWISKGFYGDGRPEKVLNPADFPAMDPCLKIEIADLPKAKEHIIRLGARLSPKADLWTETLLELDNLCIEAYNPVAGKPTGFKDATLWRPVITRRGLPETEIALAALGYKLCCEGETYNFVERKVRKAEKVLSPNYALTPYEALAYFENGPRVAENTIMHPDTGEILWIGGKTYHITPSWRRQTMLVDHSIEDEEDQTDQAKESASKAAEAADISILGNNTNINKIAGAARVKTLTERRINFGYCTFIAEAEGNKTYEVRETVTKDTISIEKERIAVEIEKASERLESIEGKKTHTYHEKKEIGTLQKTILEKTRELEEWAPMLEDFLDAFPPQVPPLASEVYAEELAGASKAIFKRFAPLLPPKPGDGLSSIKDYQLKLAALGAVKRGHLNGSTPGSGKTITSIMATWRMGHHYNWVICPTIAMKSWAAELERLGLYHEMVGYRKTETGDWENSGAYSHMRSLRKRFHRKERKTNALGLVEPEYYIISAESVCLGGDGNRVYSPWCAAHEINLPVEEVRKMIENKEIVIPAHWRQQGGHVLLWSDRGDTSKEIKHYGFDKIMKAVTFGKTIKECPSCGAEAPRWTRRGHCKDCGHRQSGITKVRSGFPERKSAPSLSCQKENFSHMPPKEGWTGDKYSLQQVPLYKMMGKHVGAKIIDEIHNWSNFHSQHGAALLQVKTKDTIVLSGTLCKTNISELEPSLCQVYEPNSGEFPYAPWGMGLFKEQFETMETETVYRTRELSNGQEHTRRKTTKKVIPEASNLTKLRALLHGVMCSVGESEMEQVWGLKPIHEAIQYVYLDPDNATVYAEWERLLQEAYAECKTDVERIGMLRRARSQLTHLAYACDGPEKLAAAVEWIKQRIAAGQRCVVVGPSTRFYTMLAKRLREEKIPHTAMGNTPPEKRFDVLNKFRDSDCPVFLSRIRLVNVNFNQLTCCTQILFTGIDPSPAALRQMQKRLNRIGQTKDVECTFLISRMPEPDQDGAEPIEASISYEERLFALVMRRETAIKQTLQQADRQRDPHELYEMLKDRQTLNQLLEDIVQKTTCDPEIMGKIREMATDFPKGKIIGEIEAKIVETTLDVEPERTVEETTRFKWNPLKKNRKVLQGELFSL